MRQACSGHEDFQPARFSRWERMDWPTEEMIAFASEYRPAPSTPPPASVCDADCCELIFSVAFF